MLGAKRKNAGMGVFRLIMIGVVAVCLLPMVSLLIASVLANLGNCALDEGSIHPCVIGGTDLGSTLYTMAVGGGWLAIATLPVLGGALLIWVGAEITEWLWNRAA